MKLLSKVKGQRFCAYCKSSRTLYVKKHLDLINVLWGFVFAFCTGCAIWGWWDPRSLVVLAGALGLSEAFVYVRWRFSIVCNHCGFDPVLYRRSPADASAKVRAFYEEKISDPHFLLSTSPLLDVYRTQVENQRRLDRLKVLAKVPEPQANRPI